MSCEIRDYIDNNTKTIMSLTSFMGGKKGSSIQFTIGGNFVCLGNDELLDLIRVISSRLMRKKGYSATGPERKNIKYKI